MYTAFKICCGAILCPSAETSQRPLSSNFHPVKFPPKSLPFAQRINLLHMGGMVFPLSHFVTSLTDTKQSSAASSRVNPQWWKRKIKFLCVKVRIYY